MKTVIADDDYAAIFTRERQQPAEHDVVVAVGVADDTAEPLRLFASIPASSFARVELHKTMREVVDSGIVNGGQIPFGPLHQVGRGRMDAHGFRDDPGQVMNALIL